MGPKIAGKEPRAPIEKKDRKSDDDEDSEDDDEGPKPLKIKQHNMEDNNKKGNRKGGKKRKKLGDLSGSDDDGDSGSDFKLSGSENSAEASEDLDSAELASESAEEVPLKRRRSKKSKKSKKKKKKRGGSSEGSGSGSDYQPRTSRRARKVIYDDFVTDGDGSEPDEEKPVKKATRTTRDSEWDSEPSESDSDYGKKKKKPAARRPTPKRKPAKKKPAKEKKKVGSDDDSEDSDFETAARKRTHKKKIVAEAEASKVDRETRGVVLNTTFADNDWHGGKEYSDDDSF